MKTTEIEMPYIGEITIAEKESKREYDSIKKITTRFIDILGAIVGLVVLCPLTLFVLIRNYINHDFGPLFFVQERIGKDGKIFKMYKFRTMIVGAEQILADFLKNDESIRAEYLTNKKLRNDPRITKMGNFLRKTSLDEFPQFINVLKGEMSLVGPRPYLPMEKEEMEPYYKYIVSLKPGLTGPWQTSGRCNLGFEDRLKLDREYCNDRNLKGDVVMIFKTVDKIIKREGAM